MEGFSKVSYGRFGVINIQSVDNITFTSSNRATIFKIKLKYILLFYISYGRFGVINIQCFLKDKSVDNITFTSSNRATIFKIKLKYIF